MSDVIEVCDYDPAWPDQFAAISRRVRSMLPRASVVAIEHVGSTAVPGLAAKPIIDLDLVIPALSDLPIVTAGLATLGYVSEGDLGIPGRHAFRWPPGTARHHLYVCARDSAELGRHLRFRDHLRSSPEDARRYEARKRELAARFRHDRDAYSRGKTAFIESLLRPL